MLDGAAAGQALLACSEETSLAHVQTTASHRSRISTSQHYYCDWPGLDGPGPWGRPVKGEEKHRGVCEQGVCWQLHLMSMLPRRSPCSLLFKVHKWQNSSPSPDPSRGVVLV